MNSLTKSILELSIETIKVTCANLRNERDELIEENEYLKSENEKLKKQIEDISNPKPKIILL